jgi:type I restriction enzyme S subunit
MVTLRKNRRLEGFTESLKEIGYQGVRKGDLVIHAMDAFAGAVGVSDSDGKCTPVYSVCMPQNGVSAKYYALIVREMARSQWILALAKGIRERSTDFRYEAFSTQHVPVPPVEEQHAIACFLDHIDRRVNRYIRAKRKLIALLNEQKQAIIHRAVTRGLDPDAPLKPSGVEWLGEIPTHWEIRRIKNLANLKSGDGITAERIEETGDYAVYGGNGLRGYTDSYTHEGDYVLIGRQGALCGNINYAQGKFWASEHALVASPVIKFNPLWFGELLRVMNLNQYSISAAQPGLAVERINILKLPYPTEDEQNTIANWITIETRGINDAIRKAIGQIDLIREYRTRLIADVVTGKLDVRAAAVALPEELTEVEEESDDAGAEAEEETGDELEEAFDGD